jgi:phosphonopyruvate decarboxylase
MISGLKLSKSLIENDDLLFTGVPCSLLKPITDPLYYKDNSKYIIAANEGDAVAIASGFYLGGKVGLVTMQNSGLGNAVNPLTSLNFTYSIPISLLISMRGSSDDYRDEPQHELMGSITEELLELLSIKVHLSKTNLLRDFEIWSNQLCNNVETTAFLIFRNQVVLDEKYIIPSSNHLIARPDQKSFNTELNTQNSEDATITRAQLIEFIMGIISDDDIIVSTTGYTSRELNTICDRNLNFYTVGSMGCASSIGLGIASVSKKRVIVLDGDGAAIMRMGALTTIGMINPPNLIHILIDNGLHESTGGQPTASTKLEKVAIACGYKHVISTVSLRELGQQFSNTSVGSTFINIKVKPGVIKKLPRPTISPKENAKRFRESILQI